MSASEFHMSSIRQHRDGVHAPRVLVENGTLMMMGRSIPVISPEQLEERLLKIGCNEEVINEIVGNLFGFRISTEAPVALTKVIEYFS